MTRDPLPVRAVLGLYPRRWRDRYGEEYAALLADLLACSSRRARLGVLVNATTGAADAHFRPPGGMPMTDRIRGSLGVAVCALVVFTIAGAGFQKMTEDQPFHVAASQHVVIGLSFSILRAAAVAAGVVALAAAVPLLWSVLRQAIAGRRLDLLVRLVLPPLAILAWLRIAKLIVMMSPRPEAHPMVNIAEVLIVMALGAVVAGFCTWCAVSILHRAELPDRLVRAQVIAMIALTVCMAAVTVSDLTWGLALRLLDGPLFNNGTEGLFATSTPPSWAIGAVVLSAATIVAAVAATRAARELRGAGAA